MPAESGRSSGRGSIPRSRDGSVPFAAPVYRGAAPEEDPLRIATLHLRLATGTWTMGFSLAHPELQIEALNRSGIDPDISVSDYWISGGPPGVWAREIGSYSDVVKVDALAEVGSGSLYRITDRNPPVVYLYRRLGLPLQFPIRIRGGRIRWEVVARGADFERVLEYARELDPELRIVSVRREPLRSHLPPLTATQRKLLARAMEEGYFAVPRGITLTELARRLERSKSSISEAIAIIEKKLLESAFQTPVFPA